PHARPLVPPRSPRLPARPSPQVKRTTWCRTLAPVPPLAPLPHQTRRPVPLPRFPDTLARDYAQTPRNRQGPHVCACSQGGWFFLPPSRGCRNGLGGFSGGNPLNPISRLSRSNNRRFSIKHQCPLRIDRRRRPPRRSHRLDGWQSDHRYVKAHVLFRLA